MTYDMEIVDQFYFWVDSFSPFPFMSTHDCSFVSLADSVYRVVKDYKNGMSNNTLIFSIPLDYVRLKTISKAGMQKEVYRWTVDIHTLS